MKITESWLKEQDACAEGIEWFIAQPDLSACNAQAEADAEIVVEKLLKEKKHEWVNWLIVRLMPHKQQVEYAIFAAEQVIKIYESKYPEDKRPQAAIAAAKEYLKNPTIKAAYAAYAAAYAAHADASYAAADASYAAAYAAHADADAAAADASYAAAYAAHAASYAAAAAHAAAYAAHADADADKDKMYRKIFSYGLPLIKGESTP